MQRVGRVGRTLSPEILTGFCNDFDFVPSMTWDTKAII